MKEAVDDSRMWVRIYRQVRMPKMAEREQQQREFRERLKVSRADWEVRLRSNMEDGVALYVVRMGMRVFVLHCVCKCYDA